MMPVVQNKCHRMFLFDIRKILNSVYFSKKSRKMFDSEEETEENVADKIGGK